MGLKESQAALARLLTETELREQFFNAPDVIGTRLKLTPGESRQLQQITASKTEALARSLQSKRRNEIAKLLPRTCDLLENGFAPLFRQFAASFTPQGVNKHREDALTFATFLRHSPALKAAPAWRRELLCYETACLQFEGRRFLARLFFHDAQALRSAGTKTQAVPFSPAVILWFRFSRKANGRVVCLHLPRLRSAPASALIRGASWRTNSGA